MDRIEINHYLLDYGYKNEEIDKILNSQFLINLKSETLYKNIKLVIKFFEDFNYNCNAIIRITKELPSIFCYSTQNLNNKIKGMIDLGYTQNDIIKMK